MYGGGAWHQMKSILFHGNRDFIHKITKLCVSWERDDKKKTFTVVYPTLCSISMLPVPFHSAADGILCHSQCPDIHNAMASRIHPSHARRHTAWDTIRVLCWGYRNDDDFISIFYIYVNTMWLINKIQLFFHSFFVLFRPQSIPRPSLMECHVTSRHPTPPTQLHPIQPNHRTAPAIQFEI